MKNNRLNYKFKRVFNTPVAFMLSCALAIKLIYLYVVDFKSYVHLVDTLNNFEDVLQGKRMNILLNIESLSDEQVEILAAQIVTLASEKRFTDKGD